MESDYYKKMEKWLNDFILKLDICPFARPSIEKKEFSLIEIKNNDIDEIIYKTQIQGKNLKQEKSLNNVLLFFPELQISFSELYELVEDILQVDNDVHFVVFHPNFQFGDTDESGPINFVNRTPYPAIHLIKRDILSQVTKDDPKIGEKINRTNELKLNSMDLSKLKSLIL